MQCTVRDGNNLPIWPCHAYGSVCGEGVVGDKYLIIFIGIGIQGLDPAFRGMGCEYWVEYFFR